MEKVSLVTDQDLTNIRNKIGYFFEGGTGFIQRKIINNINISHLKTDDRIKLASYIEKAPITDKVELENYLEKVINDREESIKDNLLKIETSKKRIEIQKQYLSEIKKLSSFEQSFNYLANEEN